MRTSILATGLLAVLASGCFYVEPAPQPVPQPTSDATITIDNASSYVLHELRVTTVRSSSWGPNLLGSDVLYPNERITVSVACGTWDVLVSDEYARDCVLSAIYLCGTDQVWAITNSTLANCGY